mgnify:FL=1
MTSFRASALFLAIVLLSSVVPTPQGVQDSGSDRVGTPPVNDVAAATSLAGPGLPGAPEGPWGDGPRAASVTSNEPVRGRPGAPLSEAVRGPSVSALTPVPALIVYATGIIGYATWYRTPGYTAAAGPLLRVGDWRGTVVVVEHRGRSVAVTLTDSCLCGERAGLPTFLDLSDAAFRQLAPLSAGVIEVSVRVGGVTLPPTDATP